MTWSGSEQVATRIAEILDIDDVFTYAAIPELADRAFPRRNVTTSRLGRTSFARNHWPWLLPVMARWWRSLDLDRYDAVVTGSHSTVNSIRVREGALHVSYCSTPMRYAWTWRTEIGRVPAPLRRAWPTIAAQLRRADRRRAQNVDLFLANSRHVAERIRHFYDRPSIVVYPPVNTEFFTPGSQEKEDYFLVAGRLVAYKQTEMAIEAAARAGVRLVVAGSGPELLRLRSLAGSNVEFRVGPSDEELRDLYRRARALVFPGVEDFGMVMVEAQACGTPVVARAEGGAREAVRDGETGLLYSTPTVEGLASALLACAKASHDVAALRRHADRFSAQTFDEAIRDVVTPLVNTEPGERSSAIARMIRERSDE
jgi:glycosyltransferase involved in cell wall biosynthesis